MYLLILIQQLIASFTHIITKDLTFRHNPALILLFRCLIAGLIFCIYLIYKKQKFEKKDIPILILLSILNIPINQFLFVVSIKFTSAPNVALAYALTPIFVLLISFPILKEKPTILKVAGILTAIIGTIMIITQNGIDLSSDTFLGDSFALLASISWGFYTVLGKKPSIKYGAINTTAFTMTCGALLYLPIFFISNNNLTQINIEVIDWLKIAYLGIFTSVIAYIIWYYALTKIEATKLSIFNNLQPVFTTLLSIILFSYAPTITFVIGGILIITGVIITQKA